MTESTTPPAGPAAPETTEPGFWDKLTTVMDEHMSKTLGKLFDGGKADVTEGKPGGDPAPGRDRSDVGAEVRREVAKLREDEQKQAEQKSLSERISELEKKLEKAAEDPPEEFRKITEWMWR